METQTIYTFTAKLEGLDLLNKKLVEAKRNLAGLKQGTIAYTNQSKAIRTMTGNMNQNAIAAKKMSSAANQLNKRGNKMIGIFKSASIAIVSAFAFRAIIGGLRGVITTFADFESQMAAVKAISGATDDQFIKLTNSAKALGNSTIFTATQVGQLQEAYARLGFTSQEILAAQAGTLALAAGTGESLASSAETAGSTLRAFGLEASETGRVADIMGASFTNSALNLERFGQSMKFVAPIARAAGFTLEETSAQLMILANNGLSGSLAGNALKNIFLRLGDANSSLNKHLGRTVQGLPQMVEALKQMKDESFGLTEATELLDKRSAPAFLALINNIEGLEDSLGILNSAEGVISQMASIRLNTLEGDFTLLKSATEGLGIAIGEVFNISLRNSVEALTNWIQKLSGSDSAMQRVKRTANAISLAFKIMIARLAILKASSLIFGPAGMIVGLRSVQKAFLRLIFLQGGVATGFRGIAAAMASTGFGAFVVLIGSLVGYFMSLNDEMGSTELMTNRVNTSFNKSMNAILLLTEGTQERTAALRKLKQEHTEMLKDYDVEIMKTKELESLMHHLNLQSELRARIARQEDVVLGLDKENQAKLKQVRTDLILVRNAIALKDISKEAGDAKITQLELEEKAILKNRVIADAVELDLLKSLKKQLQSKKNEEGDWNKFRVDANKTTRLTLRQEYIDDLENFRKLTRGKQDAELKLTNETIKDLEVIQEYKQIQSRITQASADKDGVRLRKAREEATKFAQAFTGKDFRLFLGRAAQWKTNGNLLNITIDEMKTKVANLSAALKNSGAASDESALSVHKLQRTKNQWKELFKVQTSNIKDQRDRELTAINDTFNFRNLKYTEERALMDANVESLKTQMEGGNKNQAKIDRKFLFANRNKYQALKTLTIEGWEKANAKTKAGQAERLRLMQEMLDEENAKIATNTDLQLENQETTGREIIAANIKFDEKKQLDIQAAFESEMEKENQGIANFFKTNALKVKNAEERSVEELAIAQRRFDNGELDEEAHAARKLEIAEDLSEKLNDLEDARLAKISEVYSQASAIAMGFAQNSADVAINSLNTQFEQEATDRENNFRFKLEQAEAAGQDTAAMQEQFNDQEAALEQAKEEKIMVVKRRMFVLQKANSVAMALINGAQAITKVSAETGVGAIVAAPIMSALIAAQIAMILSKKFVGEQGGIVPSGTEQFARGGMVHGARHSEGGVKFAVGGRVAELEGGEAVINRKSTKMFRSQLSAMNVAGGGVKFEQGGLTPGTNAALNASKGNWTATDIASLIAGSINAQQVFVTESSISTSQANVQIQESMSTIF